MATRGPTMGLVVLAGVVAAGLIWIFYSTHLFTLPYATGFWLVLVLWVLYSLVAGNPNPAKLSEGADGLPSSSKLQWLLWTAVALFAYTVVATALMSKPGGALPQNFPRGLLIAMGLSFGTMTAAKGVTVSYLANGKITKPGNGSSPTASPASAPPPPLPETAAPSPPAGSGAATQAAKARVRGLAALVQDDDGNPDLSKTQMLAWTIVAIVFFLWQLSQKLAQPMPDLPDIDPTLVVLMGLGQGAYIGNKLVTTDTSRLTGLTPPAVDLDAIAKGSAQITLSGVAFGDQQAGGYVTLDGLQFQNHVKWGDTQVVVTLPAKRPNGVDWKAGDRVAVNLTIGGSEVVDPLHPVFFTVTA